MFKYILCMCVLHTHTQMRERCLRDFKTLKLKSQGDITLLLCWED